MAGVAVAAAAAMLTTSCSSGSGEQATTAPAAAEKPATPAPVIKISPAEGATKVRPDKQVVVTAAAGQLQQVTLTSGGKEIDGEFDAAKARWESSTPMKPGAKYSVSATAQGAGGTVEATATFTTLKPARQLSVVDVTPAVKGEEVGVGAPIIVTFRDDVSDKKSVERALEVEAEKPAEGAWRWVSDKQVIYRTEKMWAPHQDVTFTARLQGVRAAKDMYGVKNLSKVIEIGAKQVATIDTRKHTMIVKRDGKTVQNMKISAGMATTREYTTTSGVHLAMERGNPVRMISPGRKKGDPGYYDELIPHAVRISNSGEYVHAKNNVWAQGRQNVSHGCINARPDQAKWYYENYQRADPVIIKGTDRELEWNNGWGFWQMSFKEWKKGSALS